MKQTEKELAEFYKRKKQIRDEEILLKKREKNNQLFKKIKKHYEQQAMQEQIRRNKPNGLIIDSPDGNKFKSNLPKPKM